MALFVGGRFVPDPWRRLEENEDLPSSGQVYMNFLDWHRHAPFRAHPHAKFSNVALGVVLEPDDSLEEIALDLPHLKMIALNFPKFTDGRAYSLAQILRTRYGFKGELRAIGDVLFDQLQLMQRCGFDAFEIKDPVTIRLLESGRQSGIREFYQPSVLPEAPAGTRPWARRPPE